MDDNKLFSIQGFDFTTDHIIGICIIIAIGYALFGLFNAILQRASVGKLEEGESLTLPRRIISSIVILICTFLVLAFLDLDFVLYNTDTGVFKFNLFILFLIVVQILRLIHWVINKLFIHDFYTKRDDEKNLGKFDEKDQEQEVRGILLYIIYAVAAIFLLNFFQVDKLLINESFNGDNISFKISHIFEALLIFFVAQFIVWILVNLILYNVYKNRKVDVGSQYAINQLLKYFIYVIAIVLMFGKLGFNINLLLGVGAALLVGVGLGLQQTFNDFFSGILLLFERTVAVGDVLQVGEEVGIVKKIGLRASTIETRRNITMLVPNSKLVNDTVTNWTHFDDKVRFEINVGVAYGSDTELVKKILLGVANENPYIINYPAPFVRFVSFGDNSLNFCVYYFSRNFIVIEDIKSDMRFAIDKKFREHEISIPFPQRDVWIRKSPEDK